MLCLWQFQLGLGPVGGPSLLLCVLLLFPFIVYLVIILLSPTLPTPAFSLLNITKVGLVN